VIKNGYLTRVSAGALALGLCSASAIAAPASSAAAQQPAANDGGEIVITAQKRAENVQKVPISVSAFSGQTLEKANVLNVEGLAKVVPNFSAAKGAQSTYLRLSIRGIGAASNTTVEPSVAVFLDGAYVPRIGSAVSSMLDMESVEVLRGPQGTLFGRNASVGAVSFHTVQPKLKKGTAEVTGEVGTGNRYKVTGVMNVPVGDYAAVRIAGSQTWFGGYWQNKLDNRRYGGTDESVARGSVRVSKGAIDWVLRADYSKTNGDGATNIDFDRSSVSQTQWDNFVKAVGAPDTNLNDRYMNQFMTADLHDKQWGVNSTLSWDVGGGSTLRLIDNYRDWKNNQLDGDVIFTPTPILSRIGVFGSKSQNHELQFISPKDKWVGGRLDMVGGLYYFHEKYQQGERLNENAQFCNVLVRPVGSTNNVACNNNLTTVGGPVGGINAAVQDVNQTVDSYAAYAQANFHFTDKLFATAGGRYSKDIKDGDYKQVANLFLQSQRANESLTFPHISDNRFTYRLGLNYEPTRDQLFFLTYSTGYKSAGYNSGAGSPSLTMIPAPAPAPPGTLEFHPERRVFGRETTEDWELGAKTSWLNHAVTANVTFYRMNIRGFQDRGYDGTSFTVRNAGNLRHQGFEFDGVARPFANVSFVANLAYLDSKFTDYRNAPGLPATAGTPQNLTGKPATFAPKWSGRIGVDVTGDLAGEGWTFDLNSNLSFVSKQYGGLQNDANPQTIIPGYALLGARASINAPGGWTLSVFSNNLLNKQYELGNLYQFLGGPLGLFNPATGSTGIRRLHADPRTVGASVTFRY